MEEDPSPELISLFDLEDQDKISEAGYLIITKEINRELKMGEDGGTINLSHSFNGKRVRIKLNFHHDVTNATDAHDLLNNKFVGNKNVCRELLRDLYNLSWEVEDENTE